ncbi:MAG: hypothetical protein IPM74_04935 [Crocinitomicaceae bacterium]|nr:hypothetical protein [Crocinitomicaceae bacterium]MBK8925251.1 hypothetical protein [Crocinitomicaceae bacterium]
MKMRVGFSLFFYILIRSSVLSQTWDWVDRVSGPGNNYVFTVKVDTTEETIYSTGRVKSTGTFGEISSPQSPPEFGDRDAFLTKHDKEGNLLWVRRFGSYYTEYGTSIEIYGDHIYLMGYFMDTVVVGSDTIVSKGEQDLLISKFDKNGNIIWLKSFGGLGNDQILATEIDDDGNLFFVGEFEDSINFDGINLVNTINSLTYPNTKSSYIVKLDTACQVIWALKQQSTRDISHTDIISRDDFIYVTSYYNGVCEFAPGNTLIMNSSFWQSSLMKINSDGDFVWVEGFGGNYSDNISSIDIDANNVIYLGGLYKGTATYQTEIFSSPATYLDNGMIVKLDTSGTVLDSYSFPCTSYGKVESVHVVEGKLYAAAYFSDSLFIDGDTIIGNGYYDLALYCLDTSLNLIWSSYQGGTSYDQLRSIDVFQDHSIAIGGSIKNHIDFPSISYTTMVNTYDGIMGLVYPPIEAKEFHIDSILCAGSPIIVYNESIGLVDSVEWNSDGLSVLFEDNDSAVFTSNIPGVYEINMKVSNDAESDSVLIGYIEFISNAEVVISLDSITICAGDSALVSVSGTFDDILWSTGQTSNSFYAHNTGWYLVEGTIQSLCPSYDSVFLDADILYPSVSLGSDTLQACEGDTIVLSASGSFDDLVWSNLSTNPSIDVDVEGWYTVTVNNAGLCFNQDSVNVLFDLALPLIELEASDTLFCIGDLITISAIGNFDNIVWFDNSEENSVLISSTGIYYATATTLNGCQKTDSINVTAVNCLGEVVDELVFTSVIMNGEVVAKINSTNSFGQYMICDVSGRLVLKESFDGCEIYIKDDFLPGIYLLTTNSGETIKLFFK